MTPAGRGRLLIAAGVVGGPLFVVVSLVQALTRPGFDIERHFVSMLSLGDLGWIQVANFVVTGMLAVALAAGVRRALHPGRGGTWGPLLLGGYGIGMIGIGVFTTDPGWGYPPGAPAGAPATLSWHAMLHNAAFLVAFGCLISACVVLVGWGSAFARPWWAAYSAGTGLAALELILLSEASLVPAVPAVVVLGVLASGWSAVIGLRLLRQPDAGVRPAQLPP